MHATPVPMLAVEENSVWFFKTCLNCFSKQYKMYCIRLMGRIKTKPEVAPILFFPLLFWSQVNNLLILDSFQRPLNSGWFPKQ